MRKPSITVINDENVRGVIAPTSLVSEEMLTNVIDFLELSTGKEVKRENKLIEEADRSDSWAPLKVAKKRGR